MDTVAVSAARIPPGPIKHHNSMDELFQWMEENFSRYGDIYRATVFGSNVYVVRDPDYCERILRWNWRNYARSGQMVKRISFLLGNSLIASNGEFWANQRRMIQPAFSKNAIFALAGIITEANAELLGRWKQSAVRQERVNVTQDVSAMTMKITLTSIFGEDYGSAAPAFEFLAGEWTRNLEFTQSFRALDGVILHIVAERRHSGTVAADFLGRLMEARDRKHGAPMSDAQLAKEIRTLVVAGHETTASVLNWMWYLLSRHPEVQIQLHKEFNSLPWGEIPTVEVLHKYTYTRQVIEETLRLYPPAWLVTRRAVQEDRLGDFFVPAGTEMYISPYFIQRNPNLWEASDEFRPERMRPENERERHNLATCPFGAGPRNCIGESLARIELQMHLMMFGRELSLEYHEKKSPEMTKGLNLLSKHDFMMSPRIFRAA